MPNALLTLATHLSQPALRANLAQRIMKLFQLLGKEITTPEDRVLIISNNYFMI